MPIFDYRCSCGWSGELVQAVDERDGAQCPNCLRSPERLVAAPLFRFAGRVTKGGGPDKFTADMLGIPLHDLPAGLRTNGNDLKN